MKLPNGERAWIGDKLEAYSLNEEHREGRHKARVFASVLGITSASAHMLEEALMSAAVTSDDVQDRGDNGFGHQFVLRFKLSTERGSAMILSAWIIRHNEDFPRLTTCYIL